MQKLSLKATLVGRQFDLKQVQDLNDCEVLAPAQFFGEFAFRRKQEPIGTHLQADLAEAVLSIYRLVCEGFVQLFQAETKTN